MPSLGEIGRRLFFLLRRRQFQREIAEELQFHMDRRAERNYASGMNVEEARCAARQCFGNEALLRERSVEAWGWIALDQFLRDLRLSARSLRRTPLFSATVVLTLAFGIGVNTAVFSAVQALLLNPYPFPQPDRIVSVEARHISGKNSSTGFTDFLDWKSQNTVFESMAITPWTGNYTLTGQGEPQRIVGASTTADFWKVLSIQPALGRFFTSAEEKPGKSRVVILTYPAWKRRFGSDANVLGRAITLDGQSATVIGVLPRYFAFPGVETCEFFTPLQERGSAGRTQHQYGVVARLKPGVSVDQAQADMSTVARRLELQYPATNTGWGVKVQTLRAALGEEMRRPLLMLFAVVGCVLLLACANVAGLLLARASGKVKEVAIRASLGAGRARIVRQMLTESALMSTAGGALGVLMALWLMEVLRRSAPPEFALDSTLRLNGVVLFFTLAVSLLTGVAAGILPAWTASRTEPNAVLKNEGNALSRGRAHHRIMFVLVVSEAALSMVLLSGAGLLMKSFMRILRIETGIREEHVLTFALDLPQSRYTSPAKIAGFYRGLVDRLRNSPGVEDAAGVMTLPMYGGMTGGPFQAEGRPKAADWVDTLVQYNAVTDGYFRTMGIPTARGRDFDAQDTADSVPVGIINDTLAREYFPGQDPIGQRYLDAYDGRWHTIVGVVGSVKHQQPMKPPMPEVYAPEAQWASNWMSIMVRAHGDSAGIASTARSAVHKADGDLPLIKVRTMHDVVAESISIPRLLMQLLTGFAIFAVLLDAIGIYGIVDYLTRHRTREVGIRMALGASSRNVIGSVLRDGMAPAILGAAVGIPVALGLSSVLNAVLYGTSPRDLSILLGAPAVLLIIALAASFIPARRAASLDAMTALRAE